MTQQILGFFFKSNPIEFFLNVFTIALPLPDFSLSFFMSSFSSKHKVGNVSLFVLLNFENKIEREISNFRYNLKDYDRYKVPLKRIRLLTIYNLLP